MRKLLKRALRVGIFLLALAPFSVHAASRLTASERASLLKQYLVWARTQSQLERHGVTPALEQAYEQLRRSDEVGARRTLAVLMSRMLCDKGCREPRPQDLANRNGTIESILLDLYARQSPALLQEFAGRQVEAMRDQWTRSIERNLDSWKPPLSFAERTHFAPQNLRVSFDQLAARARKDLALARALLQPSGLRRLQGMLWDALAPALLDRSQPKGYFLGQQVLGRMMGDFVREKRWPIERKYPVGLPDDGSVTTVDWGDVFVVNARDLARAADAQAWKTAAIAVPAAAGVLASTILTGGASLAAGALALAGGAGVGLNDLVEHYRKDVNASPLDAESRTQALLLALSMGSGGLSNLARSGKLAANLVNLGLSARAATQVTRAVGVLARSGLYGTLTFQGALDVMQAKDAFQRGDSEEGTRILMLGLLNLLPGGIEGFKEARVPCANLPSRLPAVRKAVKPSQESPQTSCPPGAEARPGAVVALAAEMDEIGKRVQEPRDRFQQIRAQRYFNSKPLRLDYRKAVLETLQENGIAYTIEQERVSRQQTGVTGPGKTYLRERVIIDPKGNQPLNRFAQGVQKRFGVRLAFDIDPIERHMRGYRAAYDSGRKLILLSEEALAQGRPTRSEGHEVIHASGEEKAAFAMAGVFRNPTDMESYHSYFSNDEAHAFAFNMSHASVELAKAKTLAERGSILIKSRDRSLLLEERLARSEGLLREASRLFEGSPTELGGLSQLKLLRPGVWTLEMGRGKAVVLRLDQETSARLTAIQAGGWWGRLLKLRPGTSRSAEVTFLKARVAEQFVKEREAVVLAQGWYRDLYQVLDQHLKVANLDASPELVQALRTPYQKAKRLRAEGPVVLGEVERAAVLKREQAALQAAERARSEGDALGKVAAQAPSRDLQGPAPELRWMWSEQAELTAAEAHAWRDAEAAARALGKTHEAEVAARAAEACLERQMRLQQLLEGIPTVPGP